jgi:hypothetical protein
VRIIPLAAARWHLAMGLLGCVPLAGTAQSQGTWAVASTPQITLGNDAAGSREMFAQVYGATRLANGNILVADAGDFGLRVLSPDGRLVKQYGRKGNGPGELTALNTMFRCGDSVLTVERLSQKVSVFSVDGQFARSFRFAAVEPGKVPYRSACNPSLVVHHSYYDDKDLKPGLFRSILPFWTTGLSEQRGTIVARLPGMEMQGRIGPRMRGVSEPLIGRRVVMGLGKNRLYIGSGDSYEIGIYDLSGKPLGAIRKSMTLHAVRPADTAAVKARLLSLVSEKSRPAHEREISTFEVAKTIPPYFALVVDSEGMVWVRDYPRAGDKTSRWTVFTDAGRQLAELDLPPGLEVYEIGRDYILGRFLDVEEAVPEVRLYRLTRGR